MKCETCLHKEICKACIPIFGMDKVACQYEAHELRGEWVYKKFDEKTGISDSYFCSHCGFPLTGIYNSYCPVCGADMRIKKEGDENES